jgi:prepilin-type N-terminal cleavage/methylation domain-containing protein
MKKNKRNLAFTLIELLAVVIILAIITVIAVPNVLNVIEKAKKNSFEIDAKMIAKAIETERARDSDFNPISIDANSLPTILSLPNGNYDSVDVVMIDNEIYIASVGKDKWDGLVACGTYGNMEVTEGNTCDIFTEPTAESCFTFNSATGTITNYDRANCPMYVVIPNTIGGVM